MMVMVKDVNIEQKEEYEIMLECVERKNGRETIEINDGGGIFS